MPIAVNGKGMLSTNINGLGRQSANGYGIDVGGINGSGLDRDLELYLPLHALPTSPMVSSDKNQHICSKFGAIWTPQGYSFDGDDGIVNNTRLFTAYPFTLSGWIKANSTNVTDSNTMVWIGDKDANDIHWMIRVNITTGFANIRARNITNYDTNGAVNLFDSWHYITGVFASATSRLLNVDGVNVAEGTDSITYSSAVDRFAIGYAARNTPDTYTKGTIGEVLGWSRALSVAEDMHNYLATRWRYL